MAGAGSLDHCPSCGGALTAVADGELTNFLCRPCGRCWHVELGFVSRVDPMTCRRCPRKTACVARWQAEAAVQAALLG